jgi:hypothetical protein
MWEPLDHTESCQIISTIQIQIGTYSDLSYLALCTAKTRFGVWSSHGHGEYRLRVFPAPIKMSDGAIPG